MEKERIVMRIVIRITYMKCRNRSTASFRDSMRLSVLYPLLKQDRVLDLENQRLAIVSNEPIFFFQGVISAAMIGYALSRILKTCSCRVRCLALFRLRVDSCSLQSIFENSYYADDTHVRGSKFKCCFITSE